MENTRVLIVEDEPIIAADLEDRLTEMGFHVVQLCSSGEAALAFFQQDSADLVLMDIQLEGALDGIETARRILDKQALPIIFLTSNADDATFNLAKTTRPAAFLSKPFRGRDLKHAIELAISSSAAGRTAPAPGADNGETYLFQDRLFVKSKDRLIRVFFADILWFEADDYYCKLVMRDKEILIGQPLKHMGEVLAGIPQFMRIHRSFIVNLAQVEEIGDLFVSIHKKHIPLNKSSKDELNARLQKI